MNRPKRLQLVSSGSCGPSGPVEEAGSVGHNRLKLLLITGDGLALAVGYLSVILAVGFPASHGLLRSMGVVCSAVIIGLASMRSQGLFLARVSAVRVVELTRGHIVDRQNAHTILSHFTFSSDKDAVTKLLAQ